MCCGWGADGIVDRSGTYELEVGAQAFDEGLSAVRGMSST